MSRGVAPTDRASSALSIIFRTYFHFLLLRMLLVSLRRVLYLVNSSSLFVSFSHFCLATFLLCNASSQILFDQGLDFNFFVPKVLLATLLKTSLICFRPSSTLPSTIICLLCRASLILFTKCLPIPYFSNLSMSSLIEFTGLFLPSFLSFT